MTLCPTSARVLWEASAWCRARIMASAARSSRAVHGTAPDIAGKNLANPTAAILSSAMMLDYMGHPREAERVRKAVAAVLKSGKDVTRDLGGKSNTGDMTRAIIHAMK